jgi:HlyD family secretion protein
MAVRTWTRSLIRWGILVVFLGLLGGGYLLWDYFGSARAGTSWKTEPETEGPIELDIVASGTLEPEELIDIGAQVQGQIRYFGRDPLDNRSAVVSAGLTGMLAGNGAGPLNAAALLSDRRDRTLTGGWKVVDYNAVLEEGTLLAQLDDSIYRSQVEQFEAALPGAQATLAGAQAALQVAKADYELAEGEDAIARNGGKSVTEQELFERRLAVKQKLAAVKKAEADLKKAEADLKKAEADLKLAQVNLGYTTIRSPVKGVVIDRRVNVGQTVVASLNAPSLFLIAKDLTRMQIWVSVNEADVGRIDDAMKAARARNQRVQATFTVDAHPGETFKGEVAQIRQNATMTQNVVTYTVIVDTDNKSGKLLPYMTANVRFKIARKDNVPLVPTAALRYSPTPEQVHPDFRKAYEEARAKRGGGGDGAAPSGGSPQGGGAKPQQNRGTVWVINGTYVRPIRVKTGLSDGIRTEIVEVLNNDQLTKGTEVVTGENAPAAGSGGDGTKNPFAPPPIFKRR